MRLNLRGKELVISFKHAPDTTQCFIDVFTGTDRRLERTFSGLAVCSPKDKFVKEIGRKHSLTRAIATMGCTTEERRAIWLCYLNRRDEKACESTRS